MPPIYQPPVEQTPNLSFGYNPQPGVPQRPVDQGFGPGYGASGGLPGGAQRGQAGIRKLSPAEALWLAHQQAAAIALFEAHHPGVMSGRVRSGIPGFARNDVMRQHIAAQRALAGVHGGGY